MKRSYKKPKPVPIVKVEQCPKCCDHVLCSDCAGKSHRYLSCNWRRTDDRAEISAEDMRTLLDSCTDGGSYPDYIILGVVPDHWTCKEPIELTKGGAFQAGRRLTEQEYGDVAKILGIDTRDEGLPAKA